MNSARSSSTLILNMWFFKGLWPCLEPVNHSRPKSRVKVHCKIFNVDNHLLELYKKGVSHHLCSFSINLQLVALQPATNIHTFGSDKWHSEIQDNGDSLVFSTFTDLLNRCFQLWASFSLLLLTAKLLCSKWGSGFSASVFLPIAALFQQCYLISKWATSRCSAVASQRFKRVLCFGTNVGLIFVMMVIIFICEWENLAFVFLFHCFSEHFHLWNLTHAVQHLLVVSPIISTEPLS